MKIELQSALAEMTKDEYKNPGLRYVQFVFCDDRPTENHTGIAYEDFAEVRESAIGTPIKMRFFGHGVGNHLGSVPIGHITEMAEKDLGNGVHQLIAKGILYAHDYPDEVEYLELAFAAGEAPGISWELSYSDSLIKEGISWLKGIVARAATFVRNPAYGTRTALLALASNREISNEDFKESFIAIAQEIIPNKESKGGNDNVELEEVQKKLDEAIAKLATSEAEVTRLTTENTDLAAKVDTLNTAVADKDTKIAEFEKTALVAERTKALVDAGIEIETDEVKLAKKQDFWVHLTDDAFAEYVDDLKAVASKSKKTKEAIASRLSGGVDLPRLSDDDEDTSLSGLKAKLKGLTR